VLSTSGSLYPLTKTIVPSTALPQSTGTELSRQPNSGSLTRLSLMSSQSFESLSRGLSWR
jgi:hypothetical protein